MTEVRRWATPDTAHVDTLVTSYTYDYARRRTSVTENNNSPEDYTYDKAGNVVQTITKRGHVITAAYDAAGRVTQQTVPVVLYSNTSVSCADTISGPNCEYTFPPSYSNQGYTYRAPADTAWYRYDLLGRMTYAENLDAVVQRSYLPGGALNTDTLRIRSYSGNSFDSHVYGLQYRYDALGRVRAMLHPSNLASTAQRDSFAYDAVTGELQTVVSRLGQSFGFQYDQLGRMTGETRPGGGSSSYAYDPDGRKTDHNGSTLTYDARGKLLTATYPQSSIFYNSYSGLGMLVGTDWSNVNNSGVDVSDYAMDALGNTAWRRQARDVDLARPEYQYTYEPGTTRLALIANILPTHVADQSWVDTTTLPRDSTWRSYDAGGNVTLGQTHNWHNFYGKVAAQSYFGADGRLRAIHTHDTRGVQWPTGSGTAEARGSFIEYRYDPLGRRVLVRTRRDGLCTTGQADVDCTGGIERFVWAGDNVLWELRGPGADSVPSPRLETAVGSGVEFGAVGYTHAGGVDRPLLAWKGTGTTPTLVVVPHMNWRGLFSGGTYLTGSVTTHPIVWPGFTTTAWHQNQPSQQQTKVWTGSLLGGQGDASGQMYMRNRYYDPATGQFTQTDPIGLAGGLNAYGFAAGDPVTFRDPYGLKVCFYGTSRERRSLERETERAIGASIDVGLDGCVVEVNPSNSSGRAEFQDLVDSPFTYGMRYGAGGSRFIPATRMIVIDRSDQSATFWSTEFGVCWPATEYEYISRIIAHELGHAYDRNRLFGRTRMLFAGRRAVEYSAMRRENDWARRAGEPERCRYGKDF